MRRHNDDTEALIPQESIQKLTSKQKRQFNLHIAFHLVGDALFILAFCYFCYHLPPMYSSTETPPTGSSVQSIPAPEYSILHYIIISIGLVIRLFIFSLIVFITYEINNGSFEAAKQARYLSYHLHFKAIGPLISDILFAPGLYWMINQYGIYPVSGFFLLLTELLYSSLVPNAFSVHELVYEFLMSDEERAEREALEPLMELLFERALRRCGLA